MPDRPASVSTPQQLSAAGICKAGRSASIPTVYLLSAAGICKTNRSVKSVDILRILQQRRCTRLLIHFPKRCDLCDDIPDVSGVIPGAAHRLRRHVRAVCLCHKTLKRKRLHNLRSRHRRRRCGTPASHTPGPSRRCRSSSG